MIERKKNGLRRFFDGFEATMSASAFAEAGEMETAREILRSHRQVLLVLNGQATDEKALKYAISFCSRMDSDLVILFPAERSAAIRTLLEAAATEGIRHTLHKVEECLKQAVIDFANSNTDINYIVVNDSHNLDAGCGGKAAHIPDLWNAVGCPLVVVGT